jgi:AAA ATPase domain
LPSVRSDQRGERLIEDAVGGHGTLLLVRGEAGIGKTALANGIGSRALERGAGFAVGRCYEGEGTPAFEARRDLLEELGKRT